MQLLETMAENTQFEVEVPTTDTSSIDRMIIEAFGYHLTRDRIRKEKLPPQRYGCCDLIC